MDHTCCFAAHVLDSKKIMKVYKYCLIGVVLGPAVAWGQISDLSRSQTDVEDGVEVLTRGPVHEAFAETVRFDQLIVYTRADYEGIK